MKRFRPQFVCFALIAAAVCAAVTLSASACGTSLQVRQYETTRYFSTLTRLVMFGDYGDDDARAETLWAQAQEILEQIDAAVNPDRPESDVARFNALECGDGKAERIDISPVTYELLTIARRAYDESGGAYNPAIGRSVDLWGFSPRFTDAAYIPTQPYDRVDPQTQLPDKRYVDAFAALAQGFDEIVVSQEQIDGSTRYFAVKPSVAATIDGTRYGVSLDLGGIAKGYAADRIKALLTGAGVEYGYVSVGGSSIALLKSAQRYAGARDKTDWSVAIKHPFDPSRDYLAAFARDVGLSTSGDYERYYEIDGVRYCHIVSPYDGKPIVNRSMRTASVFCDSAAYADAMSTALCVMGASRAEQTIRAARDWNAAFVSGGQNDARYFGVSGDYASFALKDAQFKMR